MKNNFAVWFSISALVICLLTLGFVTVNTISNQREAGYLERVLEETLEVHSISEQNTELLRAYVESLRQDLILNGVEPPPMPKTIKVKPVPKLKGR